MSLEGMHPLVRHMPPVLSLSITATLASEFSLKSLSTIIIPEPVPITMASYSFIEGLIFSKNK